MIKITFLGTSASVPTKERGLSAVALEYNGAVYLFDCGEGTQRQMIAHHVNSHKVAAVFISHIHGDHVIGIAGLARTLALNRRTAPLSIFIPKGQEAQLRRLLEFDHPELSYGISIVPVGAGRIYSGKGLTVTAFRLRHSVPTLGFAFKEADRTRFIKEKLGPLGIKGEAFSVLLKKGEMAVNGKKIKLSEITTLVPGKKIVYAADSRPVSGSAKAAAGADVLIHEATYAAEHGRLAKERMHSSSEEAARVAKKAGAKRLVLTHISARYRDTALLLKEAREVFRNTEIARDGTVIEV